MAETQIPATDVLFLGRRYRFAVDGPNPNVLIVQVYSADGSTFQGQAIRFRDQDGRVTADLPGVGGENFHIVNGHLDVGLGA